MNLVIVESPAKAKTINKYLGKDYKVLASYGHVRDSFQKWFCRSNKQFQNGMGIRYLFKNM